MKQTEIKNYGRSVRAKLLNVMNDTGLSYQLLLTRYLQERLLFRLSHSAYKDNFVLKGGALLYAYSGLKARPTLDIDFMASKISNDKENIKRIFVETCIISCPEDGTTFDPETVETMNITEFKEYHGVRITLTAHLDTAVQKLSIDVGFGDVMVPQPKDLDYPILVDGIPEFDISAYSLETVIAEKFEAMISLSIYNSRMKDFFDVYRIMSDNKFDERILMEAIIATFKNRGTHYVEGHPLFSEDFFKDSSRNMQWTGFVKKAKIKDAPTLEEVGKFIQQRLYPYWLNLNSPEGLNAWPHQ